MMSNKLDVSRIIKSNDTIDNVFDLMFYIYIGKYGLEDLNLEPDYSNLKQGRFLERVLADSNMVHTLDVAKEQGVINDTLELWRTREIMGDELNNEVDAKVGRLLPYMNSINSLGLTQNYTNEYLRENMKSLPSNVELQFIYVAIIARLLVYKYASQVGLLEKEFADKVKPFFDNYIRLEIKGEILSSKINLSYLTHILNYPEVKGLILVDNKRYIEEYAEHLYQTWGYDQIMKGRFTKDGATVEQKIEELQTNPRMQPNLPVLEYTKMDMFNSIKKGKLSAVNLCIYRGLHDDSVVLEKTRIENTRVGVLTNINENLYMKELHDYVQDIGSVHYQPDFENHNLISLGIDGLMLEALVKNTRIKKAKKFELDSSFEETVFIKELDDNSYVKLTINRDGLLDESDMDELVDNRLEILMSQPDATYWLLKDWGVSFDEEAFKELYKGSFEYDEPLYDLPTDKLIVAMKMSDLKQNKETAMKMYELYERNMGKN